MRLAFLIVRLFRWGGLQRDCLALAEKLRLSGHEVTIFTSTMKGDLPRHLTIKTCPVWAFTNHGRNRAFEQVMQREAVGRFDRIVGFNRMAGLDVLFCADPSYADRVHPLIMRITPRYRTMMAQEASCFSRGTTTRILALSDAQIAKYRRAWGTPGERFVVVPPHVDIARRQPQLRAGGTREQVRAKLGIPAHAQVLISVGVQPSTKGFDRVISGLASRQSAHLLVVGVSRSHASARLLVARAAITGVSDRMHLLGYREDLPELFAAADMLVHPARIETSGLVILEALVNGLPVIVTSVCGNAHHVSRADAGMVLPEPFSRAALISALDKSAISETRANWSANGIAYGAIHDLYSGLDVAAAAIVGG